jgi:monovalent cation:proton antiporter-2 (CPA2) family protein
MHSNFLFQAFIYLAAATLALPIAKRLGLGSALGYLLAGVLIGPHILGWVGSAEESVMHFAEFGVVMMLFLIGLELKPSLLWRLRVPILGMGSAQVLLTTAVFTGLGLAFDLPIKAAIALGLILAMSSTAIALQSLQERNWLKLRGGQASFSVLLFQDMAVIPILALMPLLASRRYASAVESNSLLAGLPAWQQTLAVLGAGLAVVVVGTFLSRPAFRFIAGSRLREAFTVFALCLVVGISLLMQLVGLSPALGAFLAGVVLAESEYRHELEADIEPFKGLLLGLFFLSVGAAINLPFILKHWQPVLGGAVAVVVLKFGVLIGVAALFNRRRRDALLFGFALSQVGEFAFVLIALAEQLHVLPRDWTRALVAVTAISMMATAPLLMLLAKVPMRSGNKGLVPEVEPALPEPTEKGRVILAGFGRMGNIIGRFLQANGVPLTVLDTDSELIDGVRKVGLKAYYGDASRLDTLRAAGADKAQLLILTLGDAEKSKAIGEMVHKHFPHLQILARSKSRTDAYELINAGFNRVYRETLGTSMDMGADALHLLGFRAYQARRAADAFKKFNEISVRELAPHWGKQNYFEMLRAKIVESETLIQGHSAIKDRVDAAWDNEALREEARTGELKR